MSLNNGVANKNIKEIRAHPPTVMAEAQQMMKLLSLELSRVWAVRMPLLATMALITWVGVCAAAAPSTDFDARARKIVGQMTLEEKIAQLHGIKDETHYRIVPGLSRLGIPALPLCNGPAGAGPAGPGHEGKATAMPAPISLAATWDTEAARTYGEICGSESADLGNVLLESPDVNIARTPHGGRTFEGFGEDPYLAGQIAVADIQGIQSCGVIANVKHYAANNQEQDRQKINEIIDERTLREIYLPAFEASVKEGRVGSVMAAYNQVNGEFSCQNEFLLSQVLKKEWGFDGFVTSDFGAVHSTVPCAKAGLDLELPTGKYWGDPLKQAVDSGQISQASLDDKLIRRYRTMMRFGLWDKPPVHLETPSAHAETALKLGAEGVVLLKNEGNQLPLAADQIHSIALIGPFAGQAMTGGGGSSRVSPILTVTPSDGIRKYVGENVTIHEDDGKDLAAAVNVATSADAVILMLGDRQTEGRDHPIVLGGNQSELAKAVLAANSHTVVVLKTGGPVLMPWVDQAPALVEAWYPGEEDGSIVAAVLFGKVNPSGKLPITFPKHETDTPLQSPAQYPGVDGVVHYSEGVLVGYRWYDARQIEPLFPFGYGLSYSTFAFKDLKVSSPTADNRVTIQFTVTNTGKRAGAEVAQVYVSLPSLPNVPQPPRQLKGFKRVELSAGQSAPVTLQLDARSFSCWDEAGHGWRVVPGLYSVSVGAGSRDLPLHVAFEIK
jgi:beta-glucosidase